MRKPEKYDYSKPIKIIQYKSPWLNCGFKNIGLIICYSIAKYNII